MVNRLIVPCQAILVLGYNRCRRRCILCAMARYQPIAEYYDAEYESNDMLRQDVPFFLDHLPRRSQRILEIGCGTGRVAIPLAQAGHRVVGVDCAADALAIARRKRDAVGLADRQLKLVRGDATRLRLPAAGKFDWACILFNTFLGFTTLQQQDALLEAISCSLRPGGRLWIDIYQPNLDLLARERARNLDPVVFHVPSLDRTVTRLSDIKVDPARQVSHVTFRYQWCDSAGRKHCESNSFDITFMMPREFQLLMERHGFAIERLYGNYDGSDLAPHSPRMISCGRLKRD